MSTFNENLRKYAELVLRNGINLQEGQDIVISIGTEQAYFAEMLVDVCYKELNSGMVHVQWSNESITRSKYEHASDEVMGYIPNYTVEKQREMAEKGAAMLSVVAANPDLLKGIEPKRVADFSKLAAKTFEPFRKYRQDGTVPWCIVAVSSKIWGKKVFPELSEVEAEAKLWDYIFKATRADLEDPVKAWDEHVANLKEKSEWLTSMNFKQVHYVADGTDLYVDLVKGHKWISAAFQAKKGYTNIVNVPTEEVFSVPDKYGVNGTLKSTMPLNLRGTLIDEFSFVFENGKVVDYDAKVGKEALGLLLDTDEGAKYLGEIALVPYDSPIQNLDTLFYNTLFDENASCHFALGNAITTAVEGATEMSKEEQEANNINTSLTHVDFMVGAKDLTITGIKEDGTEVPVFIEGNWA
jgi:aminopeptidase